MAEEIIETIKKDIFKRLKKRRANCDISSLHFGICLFIRNNYLWNNYIYYEELSKFFKLGNIDDISYAVYKEVFKDYISNPSK